jgi:hypothetical protein
LGARASVASFASKCAAAFVGATFAFAITGPRLARSADHFDGPAVNVDPTTDIADVYAWNDGANAVFAMTVYPQAPAGAKFSDQAIYALHAASAASYGATSNDLDIKCTFDSGTPQTASCWAGDEYVSGDASQATGIASASAKLRVFAGLRSDPFFFNLDGFKKVVETVTAADGGFTFDRGCPDLDMNTSNALVTQLKTNPDGGAPQDFFANLNALAIVVSIDKSLVTKGGKLVTVWASTNKKQ